MGNIDSQRTIALHIYESLLEADLDTHEELEPVPIYWDENDDDARTFVITRPKRSRRW